MTLLAEAGLAADVPERGVRGELVRFVVVGVGNFGLFTVLYLLLRLLMDRTPANIVATLVTTFTGTSANGQFTFGVAGAIGLRAQVKGLAVTLLGLVISVNAVDALAAGGGHVRELAVLTGVNATVGLLRFVLLRHWIFGPPGRGSGSAVTDASSAGRWGGGAKGCGLELRDGPRG